MTDISHTFANEEKKRFLWKIIFIVLAAVNLLYLGRVLTEFTSPYFGLEFLSSLSLIFVLGLLDFLVVLTYVITRHPHAGPQGRAKRGRTNTVVIILGFVVLVLAMLLYGFRTVFLQYITDGTWFEYLKSIFLFL